MSIVLYKEIETIEGVIEYKKKNGKTLLKFAKVNYLIKGMGRVPQTLFFEILNENSIFYIFF